MNMVEKAGPAPLLWAIENPYPKKKITSIRIVGLQKSPLTVAGVTLYSGTDALLRHLPSRTYRVTMAGKRISVDEATVDLGTVTRIERVTGRYSLNVTSRRLRLLFASGHNPEPPVSGSREAIFILY